MSNTLISCPQCAAQNQPGYSFCTTCGTSLDLPISVQSPAPPASELSVPKSSKTRRVGWGIAVVTIGLCALFVLKQQQPPVGEGNSTGFVAKAPLVDADVDAQTQTMAKVKALWLKGARLKGQRHFGEAAAAWKEALDLKPKHPGIQQAIDKLPVEVSYSVDAAFGRSGERCDVSYLNERQKRVRLKNVSLPWTKEFMVPSGQPLSITATSNSRKSPPVASILIGDTAVSIAAFRTLWWLGYPSQLSCRTKASYNLSSADPPTDAGSWFATEGDAALFMEKIRDAFGEKTDLLIAGAGTIRDTDILMVTLTPAWEQVTSQARLEVAQDIYRAWKGTRTPIHGKQVYILMVGGDNQRLGGSRYPNGSQLWIINQGKLGETIAMPNGASVSDLSEGSETGGESQASGDGSSETSKADIDRYLDAITNLAPDIDDQVDSTFLADEDTATVRVTREFLVYSHQRRLAYAEKFYVLWIRVHSPDGSGKAGITLVDMDDNVIGRTDEAGRVWVTP